MRRVPVLAGAVLLGAPIAAAYLLRPDTGAQAAQSQPAATRTAPARVATPPGFPAPPRGAVVFARQLGPDALALGVVPQVGRLLLQASVLNGQGVGVSRLAISFTVEGTTRRSAPCGRGCYRAVLPAGTKPAAVVVDVRGGPATRWRVALPSTWPPRDGTGLLEGAQRVWHSLRSVSLWETLGSGTGRVAVSTWQLEAPDRLAYQVRGGWSAVIVGARRWDRQPGSSRWVESPQSPVTQPSPTWVSVTDAHVLGTVTVRGRPAWRVSFFDPGSPAWFTVLLDRRTLDTLDVRMITTAHFMHDVYSAFNSTPAVRPPS